MIGFGAAVNIFDYSSPLILRSDLDLSEAGSIKLLAFHGMREVVNWHSYLLHIVKNQACCFVYIHHEERICNVLVFLHCYGVIASDKRILLKKFKQIVSV